MTNTNDKGSKSYLLSIVLVAVIGGLLFGYDTAVISGAEKGLQAFFLGAKDFVYSDFFHGVTSSSALLGCIIGAALSGYLASKYGRKKSLIMAGIMFFLSALGSYYPEFLFFPKGEPTFSLLIAFNLYRVLGGIGVGLAFTHNGSTGGMDIVNAIINKYRNISFGRATMISDIIIISSCYFVFNDWRRVMFGFVALVIMSVSLDYYINSTRRSVQFLIFSNKYEEIADYINLKLHRGVTVLDGMGWYSKQPRKVLVVLARRQDSVNLFRIIHDIDPNAFVSQSNVTGVYGEGFDKMKVVK